MKKNNQRARPRALLTLLIVTLCAGAPIASAEVASPPFSSTTRMAPDLITSQDPTEFQELTRIGRGERTVFDRRRNARITINAYLFTARYANGRAVEIQVNPEFGFSGSWQQARKYAIELGRLPRALYNGVNTMVIHRGNEAQGGRDGNILIHTDRAERLESMGFLEETLVHEGTHAALDKQHARSEGWLAAQQADPGFITTYARNHPLREDVASSFLAWMAVRYLPNRLSASQIKTIEETIPNRLSYFDRQNFAMVPITGRISDSTTEPPFTIMSAISPDVITADDINLFDSIRFLGHGSRHVYDAREGQYVSIQAYLYEAQYQGGRSIEIQINPEFTLSGAETAASRYAKTIGSLPRVLIDHIGAVVIHLGNLAPQHRDGDIIIHANWAFNLWQRGVLEEVLTRVATKPLFQLHADSPGWLAARERDTTAISDFAARSAGNDFGESFVAWLMASYRADRIDSAHLQTIRNTIPERIDYLENQGFAMFGDIAHQPRVNESTSGDAANVEPDPSTRNSRGSESSAGGLSPLVLALVVLLLLVQKRRLRSEPVGFGTGADGSRRDRRSNR